MHAMQQGGCDRRQSEAGCVSCEARNYLTGTLLLYLTCTKVVH
jgi:hypothetical protein